MVFSSFTFIFLFLPIFLGCYYLVPKSYRNTVCLVASLFFYAWGSPSVVLILIASSLVDFAISKALVGKNAKKTLWFGVAFNVLLLFYFKYANFFVGQFDLVLNVLGLPDLPWQEVLLPAGISFFTFEKISYLVDVYQRKAKPADKFSDYLLFVSLFPHLIAGPILKYHDLAQQIKERTCTKDDFFVGWTRFSLGLAKKVLIADELGKVANNIFQMDPTDLTLPYAWLGIIAYSFQIYFDFSGYSDMAIGLARMLGFRFLENFNSPYISQNITEFWRRWHISLSNWMKEYLYIPLGGNQVGPIRNYFNLVLVFTFSGLWHGASWTFLAWGIFHGLFLVIDRICWKDISKKLPKIFNILLTYVIVLIGWVLFRSDNFIDAAGYLSQMFDFTDWNVALADYFPAEVIHARGWTLLFVATLFSFIPASNGCMTKLCQVWDRLPKGLQDPLQAGLALAGIVLAILSLAEGSYTSFLYFQF